MRHCPTCFRGMQVLRLRRVEVDWCATCRALWFDRGELSRALGLEGAPAMTREQPACRCPACGGPGTRQRPGLLWFSVIDGSEVLACVDCAGCFVSEAVLRRRGAVPHAGLDASFVCAVCGDSYELAEAQETSGGFACARCRPPPPVPARPEPSTLEVLLSRVAALLR